MRKTTVREGDVRYKQGFLLFPKTINHDMRWLEFAKWKEEFGKCDWGWTAVEWIDD